MGHLPDICKFTLELLGVSFSGRANADPWFCRTSHIVYVIALRESATACARRNLFKPEKATNG